LDPAIHSIALFKGGIEKEAELLAEKKQNLEALEKNAKTEESLYKRQAMKVGAPNSEFVVVGTEDLFPAS